MLINFDEIKWENGILGEIFAGDDFAQRLYAIVTNQIGKEIFQIGYNRLKKDSGNCPLHYADDFTGKELIFSIIINDCMDMLEEALAFDEKKEIIYKHIDEFIETAIINAHHEMTAILIDYKYKNNLFTEKKWEI